MSDEVLALEAIYPELVKRHVEDGSVLWLTVPDREHVSIQVSVSSEYPVSAAPSLVDVKGADGECRKELELLLHKCWEEAGGEVCLYEFMADATNIVPEKAEEVEDVNEEITVPLINPFEGWTISEPIYDRGSTFVGYATSTNIEEEALERLERLKCDSKIRRGQHVMCAWRMKRELEGREIVFQDCDDDGETASGGRMLNLLVAMGVWNAMVVVVRWFNGTHIGPDRFRHINSAAREALLQL